MILSEDNRSMYNGSNNKVSKNNGSNNNRSNYKGTNDNGSNDDIHSFPKNFPFSSISEMVKMYHWN